jgi:hypothetical protein
MALRICVKRKRNSNSTLHLPVDAASDNASPQPYGDNPNGNHKSTSNGCMADDPYSEAMKLSAPYLYSVYDPDGRIIGQKPLRTPTPEPYDPTTYAVWYRKHYGEESYALVLGEQMLVITIHLRS